LSGTKTFSTEASERYARALFAVAEENSDIDHTEKNIIQLLNIYKKNNEFQSFVKNPTYQTNTQEKVITEISKKLNFGKNLNNFFLLIIKKRRLFFLEKILENFLTLSSKNKGKINAVISSSKELTSSEKAEVNSEISKSVGSKIDLIYKIDKTLISGIKLQLGSLLIDSSIKNKLKKYKQLMIEN
jgi:F-type H+-transporting ATPase subunit delta